jgi:hypothetical protein
VRFPRATRHKATKSAPINGFRLEIPKPT